MCLHSTIIITRDERRPAVRTAAIVLPSRFDVILVSSYPGRLLRAGRRTV
ncbi:hypothetical protein SAMN05660733_01543 [Lentzea albidocapillata]|uniref:Uncharacterized protein n=1 Tax=Lentzea albidocapillata TaxID=40571 RepID=A0A1W2BV10_9PSEU|nr:hypothetical protein SAMN05660733_01543 [Lentzea albidocapillata]